jgi:AraC-like DNA-binding protein
MARDHPEIHTDLNYLAWGLRKYGRSPQVSPPRRTWSYMLVQRGTPLLDLPAGPQQVTANQFLIVSVHDGFVWRDEADATAELLVATWETPPTMPGNRPPRGRCLSCSLDKAARARVESLFAACRREASDADRFAHSALGSLRRLVDIEFARAREAGQRETDPQLRARLAVRWMQQHLDLANPIFMLADYMQISPSSLKRLFAETLGESPSSYYHRLRMSRARELLRDGTFTVKEIAFQLGYRHPNDLSRAFKAFHGVAARKG